jgi:hypothetical protein
MSNIPTIMLIGVNSEVGQILGSYLGSKYQIQIISSDFDVKTLSIFENIEMFIMELDQPFISIEDSIQLVKSHPQYQNIPWLGMAHKQNSNKIRADHRILFEDILLSPINYEDMLTRIDLWIHTYKHACKSGVKGKSVMSHGTQ